MKHHIVDMKLPRIVANAVNEMFLSTGFDGILGLATPRYEVRPL